MKTQNIQNLLDLRPVRIREFEPNPSKSVECVTVIVPKFGTGKIGRWIGKRTGNPIYKLNLDEFGSCVWNLCDGKRSVREIADSLRERFGDRVDPVYDRLSIFIRQMKRAKLITFT